MKRTREKKKKDASFPITQFSFFYFSTSFFSIILLALVYVYPHALFNDWAGGENGIGIYRENSGRGKSTSEYERAANQVPHSTFTESSSTLSTIPSCVSLSFIYSLQRPILIPTSILPGQFSFAKKKTRIYFQKQKQKIN